MTSDEQRGIGYWVSFIGIASRVAVVRHQPESQCGESFVGMFSASLTPRVSCELRLREPSPLSLPNPLLNTDDVACAFELPPRLWNTNWKVLSDICTLCAFRAICSVGTGDKRITVPEASVPSETASLSNAGCVGSDVSMVWVRVESKIVSDAEFESGWIDKSCCP